MCRFTGEMLISCCSSVRLLMFYGVFLGCLGFYWWCPQKWITYCLGGGIGLEALLDVWNLTLLCLIWLVWKEHNSLTFEDREGLLDQLKSLLICTLFDWSHVWDFTHCNYIFEFQQSLFFCLIYCNLLDILCSFSST